mgnify:CR=1 FL=1
MEVNPRPPTAPVQDRATAAKTAALGQAVSGGEAKSEATKAVSLPEKIEIESPEFEPKDIQKAIQALQDYVEKLGRNLNFSVDEALDRPVISVRDSETKELVRQIPSEEVVAMAHRIDSKLEEWDQGFLLDSKA